MVNVRAVQEVLKTIPDPEIGVSLWDLGLVYNIDIDTKGTVDILMTLTTVGCPLFEQMAQPIREEIGKLKGVKKVTINLTFEPPWTVDRMSKDARAQLGFT